MLLLHFLNNHFGKNSLKYYLITIGIFCCFGAKAQVVKKKAPTPPATTTVAAPVTQTKPAKTDELVHTSSTKIATLADPEFKKTTTYSKQQAKHPKTFDETAKKDIKYPDGTLLHLKMVKNPSFGGTASSIKSNTVKGSEKKETKTEKGLQWDCASSKVTLTANSTSFLNADYATSAGYIYPGAIYTFDNFYNGSYKEQTGKRYPITLVNENPNIQGSAFVTVNNPGMASTTNAVDKLTNEMKGKAANEEFVYQVIETDNNAATSLLVSGGGSYAGFSASNSYSTSNQNNSVSLTIDAKKILYTINTVPQDSGFYADSKIENTPNLMVIGRVSYGIRVLANLTYTFTSSQEADNFKAAYSGFGASVNFNLNQLSKSSATSSSINCYVIGGPGNTTLSFDKKDLEKQLKEVFSGANYQNAKPIEYSFFDMSGDLVGSNSATDAFTVRNCVPNNNAAKLKSIYITYQTGNIPGDDKHNDNHYTVSLYGGNAGTSNNYNGYDNNPPQTKNNGEPFIASYKTGPLNVYFPEGSTHTDELTKNIYESSYSVLYQNLTMDYFVKHGGLIHFHVYPNGSDTWGIAKVILTLNFEGGIAQTVTWSGNDVVSLSENSSEATLMFDGTFKPRQ